jgi:hypothetical protein
MLLTIYRKQFDSKRLRNKKLKNILQCVTRQQFIRKSYDFNDNAISIDGDKCKAMSSTVVKTFFELWGKNDNNVHFGGGFKVLNGHKVWIPTSEDDGKLLVSALQVLDLFYTGMLTFLFMPLAGLHFCVGLYFITPPL